MSCWWCSGLRCFAVSDLFGSGLLFCCVVEGALFSYSLGVSVLGFVCMCGWLFGLVL